MGATFPLRHSPAELRAARRAVIESGGRVDAPLHQLDPRLARSWVRSSRAGLAPEGRSSGAPHASSTQLARALEQQREFVAHAGPVMEYLFEQTRDSGSMVILADAQGMLLHALGDLAFMDRAERVALRPGATWHEQLRGTNAIGTALADATATVVRGAEHFLDRNGFLTCAAAPILDPGGRLLGVLDISGDQRSAHPHTLGLARSGARMIEQRLFDTRHHDALRLRFHRHAEGIATLTEGLLAVSPDGWVLGANAVALQWLGLRPNQVNGVQLGAVFDLGEQEWSRWLGLGERAPRQLSTLRHGLVWARLDASPAALEGRASSVDSPAPTPLLHVAARTEGGETESPPADPLAALDLGDPVLHRAIDRARRLRDAAIPLLLQGESGVGKAAFARAWHAGGPRGQARLGLLRCTGLPAGGLADLLCTQLERGEPVIGTVFLDEVSDLTDVDQQALLQALLAAEGGPGALQGGLSSGVALVCSTRRPLAAEVAAGRFRDDLYHRLNGLMLALPPLRVRQDLPALVSRLLNELAPRRSMRVAPSLAVALQQGRWPGNLRQLATVLRIALQLVDPAEQEIGWAHLPDGLADELRGPPDEVVAPPGGAGGGGQVAGDTLKALTHQAIERALAETGGNLSETARRLGISRNTLYRRLRG